MRSQGFLGIDIGTQGLSVVLTDADLGVVATGDAEYGMTPGLPEGCYEQSPGDWERALVEAMGRLRESAPAEASPAVAAIGVSGQMHGEVLVGADGEALGPARLWCDTRNQAEADELTERFGCKVPRRCTIARWLWTLRHRRELASAARFITTPAGWIAFRLTGQRALGVGEASGMFPVDQETLDYDRAKLASFDELVGDDAPEPIGRLLPTVLRAGDDAGSLDPRGAEMLGLPGGIPVAPAEGDQPAALAGSLIGDEGTVSVSFGTSVCANSVGDRPFRGVSDAIDHFCAADGKPINMVWLRNGTTFMNTVVKMLLAAGGESEGDGFGRVMQQAVDAPADCGGLLATPFIDDEPGLGVTRGGSAMLIGLNPENASPGCVVKAALLATMFNLRRGCEVLDRQGYPRKRMVLTGGLARTPQLGQLLADVMRTPVTLLPSADEGTAWGSATLAKHRWEKLEGVVEPWPAFLARHANEERVGFDPHPATADLLDEVYRRYLETPPLTASLGED